MKILIFEPDQKQLEAAEHQANSRFRESKILATSNPEEAKRLLETDKAISFVNLNGTYCSTKKALVGLTQVIKDAKSASAA